MPVQIRTTGEGLTNRAASRMARQPHRPMAAYRAEPRALESLDGAVTASMLIFDLEAVRTQTATPYSMSLSSPCTALLVRSALHASSLVASVLSARATIEEDSHARAHPEPSCEECTQALLDACACFVTQSLRGAQKTQPRTQVGSVQEAQPCPRNLELRRSLQILASAQTHFEARLLRDVRAYKQRLLKEEGVLDTVILATCLAAVGYRVSVRTALGGGSGQECFNNLHYEFLLVSEEQSVVEYIVDPRFREQFQIPHSTPEYEALLRLAPEEYVGSSGRLKPVVKLLCGQMQEAFEAVGLTCPPWRRSQSMISKWVPAKVRDLEVASPSSSPEPRYGKGLTGMSPRGPLSRCNSGATTNSTASSTRTTTSRRAPGPAAVARPMVRQAGFELCTASSAAGENLARDSAGWEEHPKPGTAKLYGCKENLAAALSSASTGPLQTRVTVPAPASQVFPADWHVPRIRTVKMGGVRAR